MKRPCLLCFLFDRDLHGKILPQSPMHKNLRILPMRWSSLAPLIITVTAALLIYILILGFVSHFWMAGETGNGLLWKSAYKSLQTVSFNTSVEELSESGYLVLGGLLAILLAAFTVTSVVLIFWERIQLAFLITPFVSNSHVLVVGLGKAGLHIVRNLRAEKKRVVVVEREGEETACSVAIARDLGAIIVRGDISDPEVIFWAQGSKAFESYIFTGNDAVNLEIAYKLVTSSGGGQSCYFRQRSSLLCQHIQDSPAARGIGGGQSLHPINLSELTARELLLEGICVNSIAQNATVHVVILGFSQLGKAIAHELALQCHLRNGKRIRLTIVYDASMDERTEFIEQFPGFGYDVASNRDSSLASLDDWSYNPVAGGRMGVEHIVTVTFVPTQGSLTDVSLKKCLAELPRDKNLSHHVAVCISDDETINFQAARVIQEFGGKELRLHVHIPHSGSIPEILKFGNQHNNVNCFGQLSGILNPTRLRLGRIEKLSETIHESYRAGRIQASSDAPILRDELTMAKWSELQESYRRACRNRVIGFLVKITQLSAEERRIFMESDLPELRNNLGRRLVEELAEMEHNRWMSERIMDGWKWGEVRDNFNKIHPDILPFSKLSEPVKEMDRSVVEQIAVVIRGLN